VVLPFDPVEYMRASEWVDEVIDQLMGDLEEEAFMDYCFECCLELPCHLRIWSGELCGGCDCDTVLEGIDDCDEEEEEEDGDYWEADEWDYE
jgi:hypothetical protein